jgi:hypothetical protein
MIPLLLVIAICVGSVAITLLALKFPLTIGDDEY